LVQGQCSVPLGGDPELAQGQVSTALEIPYPYIYLAVPIGLGVGALYCLAHSLGHARAAVRGDPVAELERRDD